MAIERIHYLLGKNMQRVRYGKGWTQEDAARAFREHGLAAWRGSSVGQFESRTGRFPPLDHLLLMCAALGVSLKDLIPEGDEKVNLSGAVFTTSEIRALIAGDPDAIPVMADKRVGYGSSDAERHAGRKLGTDVTVIQSLARELWEPGRTLAAQHPGSARSHDAPDACRTQEGAR
jgi:transcriptional regulator with XRE-family HTH domain